MKRVVLVSGSRDFPSKALLMDVMRQSFRAGDCLIHGCARGVDSWAEEAARSAGVPVSRRPENGLVCSETPPCWLKPSRRRRI